MRVRKRQKGREMERTKSTVKRYIEGEEKGTREVGRKEERKSEERRGTG